MPLLALGFLATPNQWRFRYSLGHEDAGLGTGIWIVNFEERSHPTFIRNPVAGRDLIATGRYWIEAATGSVLKTELVIRDDSVRALLTSSFRADDRFQLSLPFEMVEEYTLQDRSWVSGRATYGRFRRFDATATETIPTGPTRWMTEPVTGGDSCRARRRGPPGPRFGGGELSEKRRSSWLAPTRGGRLGVSSPYGSCTGKFVAGSWRGCNMQPSLVSQNESPVQAVQPVREIPGQMRLEAMS
jgi:hypothetical protein